MANENNDNNDLDPNCRRFLQGRRESCLHASRGCVLVLVVVLKVSKKRSDVFINFPFFRAFSFCAANLHMYDDVWFLLLF